MELTQEQRQEECRGGAQAAGNPSGKGKTGQTRTGVQVMAKLIGLVRPLFPVMVLAVLLGVSGFLCAIFLNVFGAEALASVIGEDELSDMDKKYIKFGRAFEEKFLTQGKNENRTIDDTLNLGWELLGMLPKSELDRVSDKTLEKYYRPVEDEEV